jgi:hypothetical protein
MDQPTAANNQPAITAQQPRMFGGHLSPIHLPWPWATERLVQARNYWIATMRISGMPHSRPVWGVWLWETFFFSTGSLAAQNLAQQSAITVHLESGSEVVILEGEATVVTDAEVLQAIIVAYNAKYHWELDPQALPGPFYAVHPKIAFGWISDASGLDGGAAFHGTATRWTFPGE